jgi:hypothetical protein
MERLEKVFKTIGEREKVFNEDDVIF